VPPAEPRVVTPRLLRSWPLPEPEEDSGKHARGTVLVVGGSVGTPGAVLLAGLAALRVGAGRLQVATTHTTAVALGVTLPEAGVVGLPAGEGGSLAPAGAEQIADLAADSDAVVIGPGMLGAEPSRAVLRRLLPRLKGTLVVLDAVALTAVAGQPELLTPLRGSLVLTPNAGEVAALLGGQPDAGVTAALAVAERYGAVAVVPNGVAAPDGRVWADEAGGVGLGASGSGDVLAGTIGGLLARGAEPAQAAVYGQYLHSAAGDRLAARIGRLGFLARELLDELPTVLNALRV